MLDRWKGNKAMSENNSCCFWGSLMVRKATRKKQMISFVAFWKFYDWKGNKIRPGGRFLKP